MRTYVANEQLRVRRDEAAWRPTAARDTAKQGPMAPLVESDRNNLALGLLDPRKDDRRIGGMGGEPGRVEADGERGDEGERRRVGIEGERVNLVRVRSYVDVEDHGFGVQEGRALQQAL